VSEFEARTAVFYCRAFLTPASRGWATHELASRREAAIPLLRAIFAGDARNEHGVPYRNLGMPLGCALVTAGLLGSVAQSLEDFVRSELEGVWAVYAKDALARLGQDGSET